MHDFTNLNIWKKAIELAELVYSVTAQFPEKERYGLTSQMRRCSVSISSNIAEGCGRNGNKELIHFLAIANGSTCELESQLILANRLCFVNEESKELITNKIEEIKNMNFKFQKSISYKIK